MTAAEIVQQSAQKPETPKPKAPVKSDVEKAIESVPVKKEKKLPPQMDEIKRADDGPAKSVQRKPLALSKLIDKRTVPPKKKKVISLRDIPADEIYIPLKGPEVDFEEIIRKASPKLKRKEENKKESADEIYIPLHSPPKSSVQSSVQPSEESTFKQNFDDGIYIPLHSPPKSPKPEKSNVSKSAVGVPVLSSSISDKKPKKKSYEVCDDNSIFIPLHSPEEERSARTFEEEIRRVDQELQKAREAAERRQRDEDRQHKPVTLDLSDSGSNRSRLSQTFPSGKPGNLKYLYK